MRRSATAGRQRRATRARREAGIAAADSAAILVFATVGQLSHHGHLSAAGYARDALPLLVGWFFAFGAFRGRFLPTWLVGVSAGVLLRAAILSHWYAKELAFWGVALVFVGALAAAMRGAAGIARRRRTGR